MVVSLITQGEHIHDEPISLFNQLPQSPLDIIIIWNVKMAARINNISWLAIPVGREWFFIGSYFEKLKIIKTCFCFAVFKHVHFKRTHSFDIRCLWNIKRFVQNLWKRYEFDWDAFDVTIGKFYKVSRRLNQNFLLKHSMESKILSTTTYTVHKPLVMMTLVIISYNFNIFREKGCEVKYIPRSELRGATIVLQMNGDIARKMRVNLFDLVHYFQNR